MNEKDINTRLENLLEHLKEIGDKVDDLKQDRDFWKEQAELWRKNFQRVTLEKGELQEQIDKVSDSMNVSWDELVNLDD